MQKSKIDIARFRHLWYANLDIDIDAITDPTLKRMYQRYAAQEDDLADLYEEIGEYLDANSGSRHSVYGTSDEDADEQPNGKRLGLFGSSTH